MTNQITVTESLANGLKSRFFSEMIKGADLAQKKYLDKQVQLNSRNDFIKLSQNVRTSLKDYAILVYEGGSVRKPYVAFDLLTAIKDREYNSWNEKCLTGSSMVYSLDMNYFFSAYSPYNIGEHAISRLFLRTKPEFIDGVIDYKYITKELVNIPLWANFWGLIASTFKDPGAVPKFSPVIPTPSGLLMCEYFKDSKKLEIRTFVHDELLSEDQLKAKELLSEIGCDFYASPISFIVLITPGEIDNPDVLFALMGSKIYENPKYGNLRNVLFNKIENDIERAEKKAQLDSILKNFLNEGRDILLDLLSRIGVRRFQIEIKKTIYRNSSK
jgi:hypothetical protein